MGPVGDFLDCMGEIRGSTARMENNPLLTRFYTSQVVQDFFHQQNQQYSQQNDDVQKGGESHARK